MRYYLILLIIMFMNIGCATRSTHVVVNNGKTDLTAVSVETGKYKFGHGNVSVGTHSSAAIGGMKFKKSSPIVVSWRIVGESNVISSILNLERNPRMNEEVVFYLNDDQVRVECMRFWAEPRKE